MEIKLSHFALTLYEFVIYFVSLQIPRSLLAVSGREHFCLHSETKNHRNHLLSNFVFYLCRFPKTDSVNLICPQDKDFCVRNLLDARNKSVDAIAI